MCARQRRRHTLGGFAAAMTVRCCALCASLCCVVLGSQASRETDRLFGGQQANSSSMKCHENERAIENELQANKIKK